MNVSPSPHVKHRLSTSMIMYLVIIALLPTTIYGVVHFGLYSLILVVVTTATAVATEFIYEVLMNKKVTVKDGSAFLTGLLLALNLPPTLPIAFGMLGSIFAIIIVKQLFGGLGQNFMNPALGGRCFLLISFTGPMTHFVNDGVTCATPLAQIKAGETVELAKLFLGNTGGTIGETCALAILIGGIVLCAIGIVDWKIPVSYLLTFSAFALLFGGHGFDLYYLACEICGGGLLLGAFFMATDYVTSPVTFKGRIIYGIILGILTGLFRIFGGSAEGVSYAIIFTNLLVPLIERFTIPKAFGRGGEEK